MRYMQKFLTLSPAYFQGTVKDTNNWKKNYFLNLKLIKECSGYHFHYFLTFSDRYVNENC